MRLLVRRGCQLVGIDYYSICPFDDVMTTHRILLEAGVYILESLVLGDIWAGPVDLIKEDLLGWALGGPPRFDLPLQGAELAVGKSAWEATLELGEEGMALEAGGFLQQVAELGPDVLERILPGPPGSWGERFTGQAIRLPVLSS